MSRLIMMVGLPGSGKTTYAKYIYDTLRKSVIHSSDVIRRELFGLEEKQINPEVVFNLLYKRAAIDLRNGMDVIFDATNIKAEDRKNAIQAITSDLPTIEIIAVIMDTDIETCRNNNACRQRIVPNYAYERMMVEYSLPSFSEGFNQIISVQRNQSNPCMESSKETIAKSNTETIEFTGVFFERALLYDLVSEHFGKGRLYQDVLHPHVTFQYMPQLIREDLFGENVEFRIVGYGNDGLNEGLSVEWLSGAPQVKKLYDEIPIPHITLSYAEYGSAVNTRYLDFKPITPFSISGVFGGCSQNGDNTLITKTENINVIMQ